MSKLILSNKLDFSNFSGVASVANGGTGASVPDLATNNLNIFGVEDRNASGGIAGLNEVGELYLDQIPASLRNSGGLLGNATVPVNSTTVYTIAGYSSFLLYTITTDAGTVTQNGNQLTFVAPSSPMAVKITLNGRVFNINVVPITTYVNTPIINTPTPGSGNLSANVGFTSSVFAVSNGSDTHEGTDWQIATDANFANIVSSVTDSSSNKVSWSVTGLLANTTYYVRLRYKGAIVGYSNWSAVATYTTKTKFYPSAEESITYGASPATNDFYGDGIDLSENGLYAVMGGYGHDSNGLTDSGVADIYTKSGTTWARQARFVATTNAGTMALTVPSGGSIRVVITGATPSDTTYTSSQSVSIPVGSDSITLFGKGGPGTTINDPGQAYIAPTYTTVTTGGWSVMATSANDPSPGTTLTPNYTVMSGRPYPSSTGTYVGQQINMGAWSQEVSRDPYAYNNFPASWYEWYTSTSQVQTSPGQPYIAPSTSYTTGSSTTVNYGGQTYTFAGGYGGAATVTTQTVAMLFASDAFGKAAAVSSDGATVAIGAYGGENTSNIATGVVYIFTRSGSVWTQQAKLQASDGAVNNYFGYSVSLTSDGNYAIIGAYNATIGSNSSQGASYVFIRSGSTWSQQSKLTASDGTASAYFGTSVKISNDSTTAIIGASGGKNASSAATGVAYIFTRSGTAWTQQAKIIPADGAAGDNFGASVSISADGNTSVVGSAINASAAGAAYIFTRSGTTWTQQAKLVGSDTAAGDNFASSVDISSNGDFIVAGASRKGSTDIGSTYTFSRTAGVWTQEAILNPSTNEASAKFGMRVAVSGDATSCLVSSQLADAGGATDTGAVFTFI